MYAKYQVYLLRFKSYSEDKVDNIQTDKQADVKKPRSLDPGHKQVKNKFVLNVIK